MRQLDPPEEQPVIAAAGEPNEAVRLAALERLGQIGSAASVPVLFNAATKGADNAKKVATAALASVAGAGAGEAIKKLAAQGDAGESTAAISILARRYDQAALPALLQYAAESDRAVSGAACDAFGRIGPTTNWKAWSGWFLPEGPPGRGLPCKPSPAAPRIGPPPPER